MLLDALSSYEGTLVLVSHDRAFVSPLVDAVLEIEPSPQGSRVVQLIGSYDDYLARKLKEASVSARKLATDTSPGSSPPVAGTDARSTRAGPSNNQRKAWEKEREKAEADITVMERRQGELGTLLSDSAVYGDKPRLMALMEEQRAVQKALGEKLSRWEELSSLLGQSS